MNGLVAGLALSAAAAACASDEGRAAPSPPVKDHSKGSNMAKKLPGDEFPAVVAFRAHAAQKLGISVEQVQGGPTSEAHAALFKDQRVGKLWAFVMWKPESKKEPKVEVRGWASPDGKVITLEQNLGLLFAEAGAWGDGVQPPLDGKAIAERLLWSLADYTLEIDNALGLPYPELVMKDGAGSLRFAIGWRQPGPGGAGGGPVTRTLVAVSLAKDRTAVAVKTPVKP